MNYELALFALLVPYGIALLFLLVYGLMQMQLVYQYLHVKRKERKPAHGPVPAEKAILPLVTVQLPIYNEEHVSERLIDAVAHFHYPSDRFQIQVLDDSTDKTVEIVRRKVAEWRQQGLDITHVRRAHRTGYKAGALAAALPQATGEFIVIFDADFVPKPDFLTETIPAFDDPHIGMAQTRWDHLNKQHSLLTHVQSFLLDAHFSIEQVGRNASGYFINFSGTGGVWRKSCIIDAGGWHSDTLTEDFDLSYRAQLRGWKFKYLEHVGVPAELPPVMSALRSQQHRWVKGITETSKKHLRQVLKAKVPGLVKLHAVLHLLVGLEFVSALVCSIISVPLLLLKQQVPHLQYLFQYTSFSLLTLVFLAIFHYVATVHTQSAPEANAQKYFWRVFPLYLCFSMGISLHNSLAVIRGWLGIKTPFVRTPKFNVTDGQQAILSAAHGVTRIARLSLAEGFMVLYFLTGAALSVYVQDFSMLPYHLLLAFGFGMICWYSWHETQKLGSG